jgi:RNA polymerase sigma-70 factor, ECF subfamily
MADTDGVGSQAESDERLAQRTAAGDRDAFVALYRRHHHSVYRFARLMTGSAVAAEDIVQEVFLVLMRDASRYNPARAALSTYLFGVGRQLIRRRLRRERRFVSLGTTGHATDWPAPGDTAVEHEHACERCQIA